MSHVATIEVEITNLADLKAAVEELGMEWAEGQLTYNWYGEHVGDYPLPAGFGIEDLGRCQHAIKLSLQDRAAEFARSQVMPYEIGVVARRDGKPGWVLLWDFFAGGFGLEDKIGKDAGRLKQAIATAASVRTMTQQGWRVQRHTLASGTVQLQFTR